MRRDELGVVKQVGGGWVHNAQGHHRGGEG